MLEAVALVFLRSLFVTALVRAAWPATVEWPGFVAEWRRVARFVAIVALALLPFAVLAFATAVTALSWLFFVSVPVLVMAATLVHPGVVSGSWWRDRPTWDTVRVVLLAFALLTAAGAVLTAVPTWAQPPLAALAGLGDAWCWLHLVHAGQAWRRSAGAAPSSSSRSRASWCSSSAGRPRGSPCRSPSRTAGRQSRPSASATGPPVLIVKGFNSEWDGITRQWVHGRYRIRRFSYAGLDVHGQARPYGRADTHQSLPALAQELRTQVDAFRAATGQPVSIVAESEGALVALAYVATTPHAPVPAVIALSPLLVPGRVYYPTVGDAGWGTVAGTVLDGLARRAERRRPGRRVGRHRPLPVLRRQGARAAGAAALRAPGSPQPRGHPARLRRGVARAGDDRAAPRGRPCVPRRPARRPHDGRAHRRRVGRPPDVRLGLLVGRGRRRRRAGRGVASAGPGDGPRARVALTAVTERLPRRAAPRSASG